MSQGFVRLLHPLSEKRRIFHKTHFQQEVASYGSPEGNGVTKSLFSFSFLFIWWNCNYEWEGRSQHTVLLPKLFLRFNFFILNKVSSAQCPHAISINAMWPYAINLITFCLKTQSCSVLLLFSFSKK